jgi:hypothetical protein
MNIKETFLKLTAYEIPYGFEKNIEFFLPKNINKDEFGNYYLKIGETKTIFCCHLDTYSRVYQRVKHRIKGNIISTDGTTILGGDDKAGVCVLLSMIESNISGLYYFFRGEEGLLAPSGTWGSKNALKKYADKFKNYNKCIAFDRKKKGSIITHQMWQECCSSEFAKSLIDEFKKAGMNYQEDDGGFWCDSGTFMEDISECTNISVGYDNEHTKNEIQDIDYLDKLCKTVIKIDWENLIVKRDPSIYETGIVYKSAGRQSKYNFEDDDYYRKKYGYLYDDEDAYAADDYFYDLKNNKRKNKNKKDLLFTPKSEREYHTMQQMFQHVLDIMDTIDYECFNGEYFGESYDMFFMNTNTNDNFLLKITDFKIYITEDPESKTYILIGDLDTFENYVTLGASYYNEDKQKNNDNDVFETDVKSITDLKESQQVYHTKLGKGYISKMTDIGKDIKITIFFYDEKTFKDFYFNSVKHLLKIKSENINNNSEYNFNLKESNILDISTVKTIYHTYYGEGKLLSITDINKKDPKISIKFYKDNLSLDFDFNTVKHLLKVKESELFKQNNKNDEEYSVKINSLNELLPRTQVYHPKFGEGVINDVEGTDENAKISIYFYDTDDIKLFQFKIVKNILKLKLPF